MALQFVGYATAGKDGASSGNSTLSLTGLTGGIASAAAANDIVIAGFCVSSGGADRDLTITDGTSNYTLVGTEIYHHPGDRSTNLRVAFKIMGSTPDTTTTFGPTGSAANAGTMFVHVWRGVDLTTPQDVTAVTATGGSSVRPNPGSITPTTSGAIILAIGGGAHGNGTQTFSSSELSNFASVGHNDTDDATIGIGSYAWTSGAFDPATWTFSGSDGTGYSWGAITMALRPAASTNTSSMFLMF